MAKDQEPDVERVQAIDAVPSILEVLTEVTGMRFAAIARVTENSWTACAVRDTLNFGMQPGDEMEISKTFCDRIMRTGTSVCFDHASADPVYKRDPLPKLYGFESYISVPIKHPDGTYFGTLCALDSEPRHVVTGGNMKMFELFAELLGRQLMVQDSLTETRSMLDGERHTSRLRDQFVAILGHDLRNPLAAINAGAQMLRRRCSGKEELQILDLLQASAHRMDQLIHSMLDFARTRFGDGIPVTPEPTEKLPELLQQTAEELRIAHPDCRIETRIDIEGTVYCDVQRVAQVTSNLLSNARLHGVAGGRIELVAEATDDDVQITVINDGPDLPADLLVGRFEPFRRSENIQRSDSLGLGLFICAQIAKAHKGTLCASQEDGRTHFTLSIPRHMGAGTA